MEANTATTNNNIVKVDRYDRNGSLITTFIGKYSIANRKLKKNLKNNCAEGIGSEDKLNGDENATDVSDDSPTKK